MSRAFFWEKGGHGKDGNSKYPGPEDPVLG